MARPVPAAFRKQKTRGALRSRLKPRAAAGKFKSQRGVKSALKKTGGGCGCGCSGR